MKRRTQVALAAFLVLLPMFVAAQQECQYVYMNCYNCYKNMCWCSSYNQISVYGGYNTYYDCNFTTSECESCGSYGPCWWIDASIHSECNGIGYHHYSYLCCDQY